MNDHQYKFEETTIRINPINIFEYKYINIYFHREGLHREAKGASRGTVPAP